VERCNLCKRNDPSFLSFAGRWIPSWPIFISLGFHGLMICFLLTWDYPRPGENLPIVVMVRIVEETEKIRIPMLPIFPKPEPVPRKEQLKQKPSWLSPPKAAEPSADRVLEAAPQKTSEILPVSVEKHGIEKELKEKMMEKTEPGRWGAPEGPIAAEPVRLGKEEPPTSITVDPGSAQKGIPGGLTAVNPWGKGTGDESGYPGGVEGGKGTVPAKGAKTGSVHFQGEGKGRGDLGSYLGNARMRIEKAKRYPREARRMGWEGKVVVSFQVNRKGEVAGIRLIQSSGYEELDREALATLRRASPFSPPPLNEEERLELEIPLVFKLE
jgi:TonB family protein